jgi:hypothetical protein
MLESIVNSLTLSTNAFIDKRFQPALSGQQFPKTIGIDLSDRTSTDLVG